MYILRRERSQRLEDDEDRVCMHVGGAVRGVLVGGVVYDAHVCVWGGGRCVVCMGKRGRVTISAVPT